MIIIRVNAIIEAIVFLLVIVFTFFSFSHIFFVKIELVESANKNHSPIVSEQNKDGILTKSKNTQTTRRICE